uniref:Uncharacterized protein n=1 Tax=Solanum lycopersicum TaxID=4081 RepID=A0A3Q7ECR3_SOLLC
GPHLHHLSTFRKPPEYP